MKLTYLLDNIKCLRKKIFDIWYTAGIATGWQQAESVQKNNDNYRQKSLFILECLIYRFMRFAFECD